ncbi:hypothetical protein A1A1_07899 [Planococcus antarcticus DSM 14505]|uniref:Uncharacterized protein n=1 Tax=Planococcus antarcticus DSM 14505 TaxID=1185653 RepID=A0AA87IMG8_9BACL|nr:hypothetical protein A1A1_07899 [Planococcus antarcticus DSM 14505]
MVVSVSGREDKTGMVWAVPITSATDKFPTHFSVETKEEKVTGTVENMWKCKKLLTAYYTYLSRGY